MGNALFDVAKGSDRNGSLSSLLLGAVVLFLLSDIATKEVSPSSSDDTDSDASTDECSDGIDNDFDGDTDSADLECDPTNPEYDGTESGSGPPMGGP